MRDDDEGVIRIGPSDGRCFVFFGAPQRPHDDDLTFFPARVVGDGVEAEVVVESLGGDHGFRLDEIKRRGDVEILNDARLADFLRDLGSVKTPWEGERGWRSLADELRILASCDARGHVDLAFTLQPRPWEPSWSATVLVKFNLGDLLSVASDLDHWRSQLGRT